MRPELSIVLPSYNERENILVLLEEIKKYVEIPYEVVVVDDDSPDETWKKVAEYSTMHPEVKLLRRINERGLTSALNAGLNISQGRLLMWMDVDLSMPPDRIPVLLKAIDNGADVAVGSRYIKGGRDARAATPLLVVQLLLSKALSVLGRWILNCNFRDWSSGFIALKRSVLQDYQLTGDYGEYFIALIYHLIKRRNAVVVEVPYILTPRRYGESKTATELWGFFTRGQKYLRTVWRQRFGQGHS